jgi:uncharacterized protein YdaU (DUF1376 family)
MATARPDTWMPIYWGDYAKDTGHLSAAHHGAYLMLIKHYWVTGKALPIDDAQLWRIACADSLAHWRKLKPVVLSFFEQRDGALHHGRVEKELLAAGEHAERRAEMARRASRARWGGNSGGKPPSSPLSNAPRMPDAMPGQSPPPSPSPDVTTTPSVADSARANEAEPWEPVDDGLEIPSFLRKAPAARAQPIPPDWLPSKETQSRLVKARPDLTPERIVERTVEFRNWCAESNKLTHNPDATWFNFMVKTHAERHRKDDDRPAERSTAAALAGLAAAGARGRPGP